MKYQIRVEEEKVTEDRHFDLSKLLILLKKIGRKVGATGLDSRLHDDERGQG